MKIYRYLLLILVYILGYQCSYAQKGSIVNVTYTFTDYVTLSGKDAQLLLPYTFVCKNSTDLFAQQFFTNIEKDKIALFEDDKLGTVLAATEAHKLATKIKSAPAGTYELTFGMNEDWLLEENKITGRSAHYAFLLIADNTTSTQTIDTLYIRTNGLSLGVDQLTCYTDYNGFSQIQKKDIFNLHLYNIKILAINKSELTIPECYQINAKHGLLAHNQWATSQKLLTVANYKFMLPSYLDANNFVSDLLPDSACSLKNNKELYRFVIPAIVQDVLLGKLKIYRTTDNKVIPLLEVRKTFENHSENPAEVFNYNIKHIDYSFCVKDIEVEGKLDKTQKGDIVFIPTSIALIMTDINTETVKDNIGYIPVNKLNNKRYKINDLSLESFIKKRSYYYYMTRANTTHVRSIKEAYYVDFLLLNDWNKVPTQYTIEQMKDDELVNAIKLNYKLLK